MDAHDDSAAVLRAAQARAAALAAGDAVALTALLHEDFAWTTHRGDVHDRGDYVARNTDGTTRWRAQLLGDAQVVVVGDTAVLRAEVRDVVDGVADGEEFVMPMTQTWVREAGRWRCLAGHAGPRRESALSVGARRDR